jgi:adenine-specific DNA-methyltransferase
VSLIQSTWQIKGTDVYLIYTNSIEELKNLAITRDWLETVKEKEGKKIVYAPACFLDKEILDEYNISFVQIPFNLFSRT